MVLIRCYPNCLVFMNSWGQKFADRGFFRVQDEKVLHNLEIFDAYWEEDDLTTSEKEAFERKGVEGWKQIFGKIQKHPGITIHVPTLQGGV